MTSGSSIQFISRIFFTAILARLIPVEDFGLMATAMIMVGLAELFTQIGLGPALVQIKEISQKKSILLSLPH